MEGCKLIGDNFMNIETEIITLPNEFIFEINLVKKLYELFNFHVIDVYSLCLRSLIYSFIDPLTHSSHFFIVL